MELFSIEKIYAGYSRTPILKDISFRIPTGSSFGIIGPNGSGKSTLLKVMTGLIKPLKGKVLLNHKELSAYTRKELAQHIAVLEQEGTPPIPFTVDQVVAMGRYPWLKTFDSLSDNDQNIIDETIDALNLNSIRKKKLNELSGGERQLVSLARALAQKPKILILDEPTTFLDIGNQLQVMHFIREWHTQNLTVIMVLHDLNVVSQYCDYALLMNKGKIHSWGHLPHVLNVQNINEVYDTSILQIKHPVSKVPQFLTAYL